MLKINYKYIKYKQKNQKEHYNKQIKILEKFKKNIKILK